MTIRPSILVAAICGMLFSLSLNAQSPFPSVPASYQPGIVPAQQPPPANSYSYWIPAIGGSVVITVTTNTVGTLRAIGCLPDGTRIPMRIITNSASGCYAPVAYAGCNVQGFETDSWTLPPPAPVVLNFACGGVNFWSVTNPTCNRLFKALATTTPGLWSIADTDDIAHGWSNAFTFVTASNGDLTVRAQNQ